MTSRSFRADEYSNTPGARLPPGATYHGHMRTPSPRSQRRAVLPHGTVDASVAARVTYVGSPEHKDYPSPAGPPRLRSDATKCGALVHNADTFGSLSQQLQLAIVRGAVGGPLEGDYPRYVWAKVQDQWYEARLTNREQRQYKGYAIRLEEVPRELS